MQHMDRPGRFYTLPAPERDRQIVQLRQRGWTYAKIGKRVGMTESGVRRSIERIREGGFGQGQAPR
jgi:DNA-directed RNA polymerase specialized sigma24 family protein